MEGKDERERERTSKGSPAHNRWATEAREPQVGGIGGAVAAAIAVRLEPLCGVAVERKQGAVLLTAGKAVLFA